MAELVVRFADGTTGHVRGVSPTDRVDQVVADLIAGRDRPVMFPNVVTRQDEEHRTGDIVEITIRLS